METSTYELDLDHISLAEWLVELGRLADRQGYQASRGFITETGALEWYAKYEAGLSPEAALDTAAMEGVAYSDIYRE